MVFEHSVKWWLHGLATVLALILARRARSQERRAAGHVVASVGQQRGECWRSAASSFPCFCSVRDHNPQMLSTFRIGLESAMKPLWRGPHGLYWCISSATPNAAKVAVEIMHPSHLRKMLEPRQDAGLLFLLTQIKASRSRHFVLLYFANKCLREPRA